MRPLIPAAARSPWLTLRTAGTTRPPRAEIKGEDVARLSPLKDRHINFLGRYLFNIQDSGPAQGLRPFRDPNTAEDAENEKVVR